jgi:hypothetical protein
VNQPELERQLSALDPDVLAGLVRQALNSSTARILDWGYVRISTGRGPATSGLTIYPLLDLADEARDLL